MKNVKITKTNNGAKSLISANGYYEECTKREFGSHGNQRRDCTVTAIAHACDVDYNAAFDWCKKNGRKSASGFALSSVLQMTAALGNKVLGKTLHFVEFADIEVTQFFASQMFEKGRFILSQKRHAIGMVDGIVIDHTRDPNARVLSLVEFI